MIPRVAFRIFCFGLSLGMTACGPQLDRKPKDAELHGRWVLAKDNGSINHYFKCDLANTLLILNPDGTYKATQLPIVSMDKHGAGAQLVYPCVTTKGTWKCEKMQFWVVTLFTEEYGGVSFEVHQLFGKIILFAYYVDPDGQGYALERQE